MTTFSMSMEAVAASSFDTVPTLYTNWRGVTAIRHLTPVSAIPFCWGKSEYHKGPDGKPLPQWFFRAVDVEREKEGARDFAVSGFKAFGQEALDAIGWRARGEADPHGDRYDCSRHQIAGGHLTDDQVAYQTAMLMRGDLNHEGVLNVAKDRIRWLSRRVAALEALAATPAEGHSA